MVDLESPRIASPGRPRVTNRRAIRDAAMREFAAHGYAATSVKQIAEAAGIGRNTFFRYFTSKVDLLGADYASNQELLARRLRSAPTSGDVLGEVVAAVQDSLQYEDSDREFYRMRRAVLAADPTVPPEWSVPVAGTWSELIAAYVLASATDQGPSSRAVAHAVGAGVQGVLGSVMETWSDGEHDLAVALDLFDATARTVFGPAVHALTTTQRRQARR